MPAFLCCSRGEGGSHEATSNRRRITYLELHELHELVIEQASLQTLIEKDFNGLVDL